MAESRRYKAINFDLDTQALRNLFGERGRSSAYSRIKNFLSRHGFEHRQGSGYRSTTTMTDSETVDLVVSLYSKFDWLPGCVQKLDVTNIGREYDMDTIAKRHIADELEARLTAFDIEI
jgi:virulence-associated protein VapD